MTGAGSSQRVSRTIARALAGQRAQISWHRSRSLITGTGWPHGERDIDRVGREALAAYDAESDVDLQHAPVKHCSCCDGEPPCPDDCSLPDDARDPS